MARRLFYLAEQSQGGKTTSLLPPLIAALIVLVLGLLGLALIG